MKRNVIAMLLAILSVSFCACGTEEGESFSDYTDSEYTEFDSGIDESYDDEASDEYDYGMPEEGESFSDYVEREDSELYDSMEDTYNDDISDEYDYGMPEEGESFSDYVERVAPELYDSMEDRYDDMKNYYQ